MYALRARELVGLVAVQELKVTIPVTPTLSEPSMSRMTFLSMMKEKAYIRAPFRNHLLNRHGLFS